MHRLVSAEVLKLLTTRLWLWLLLASMMLTALYVSLSIAFGDDPGNPTPPLASPPGQRTLFALASGGSGALVAVLAAIGLTSELRHHTATSTFLATPSRGRIVVAKLIAYSLAGAGYALAAIAITAAITLPWLGARGITVPLTGNGIPATLAAVVAANVIFALSGVGLGAIVRDQAATVVGLLLYLYVAEPIVTRIPALQAWTAYLPGTAKDALTNVAYDDLSVIAPWQGGLVFAGYGLVLAAAGTCWGIRRDLT
jgi:ABC-type transport system involved in multi-copper enzyme maturation permease subunit